MPNSKLLAVPNQFHIVFHESELFAPLFPERKGGICIFILKLSKYAHFVRLI